MMIQVIYSDVFLLKGGMIKSFIGLGSGSGFCHSPDGNEYFGYFLTPNPNHMKQVTKCPWDECNHIVMSLFMFLSFGDEGSYFIPCGSVDKVGLYIYIGYMFSIPSYMIDYSELFQGSC